MFFKSGVDEVRMDDIASEMSISKRTLYEIFGSKEDLVLDCLDFHSRIHSGLVEKMLAGGSDVLSVAMDYLEILYAESGNTVFSPVRNLEKYPKLKEKFEECRDGVRENMRCFINLGVSQGVIRDDVNIEILLKTFASTGQVCIQEEYADKYSLESCVNSTFLVLLRGIATREGLEKIEEHTDNKRKNK